ncbi:fungal transcriptional regulatory protein [Sporothrix schenckii 1099-18]|uniref:Fungal transcriptional regulatory protein n=1 Tax=Sporothrix schenckii 1099-18 TaxID=1397361 RepID=A0A0F2M053_SPOSC|nr:fungal transcriptional regulatory protein [Sporothrix schenckii 1099-18]KJR82449.1 fungal transcriptional regulatory protein [Sporothrix schenckii 1099-18]
MTSTNNNGNNGSSNPVYSRVRGKPLPQTNILQTSSQPQQQRQQTPSSQQQTIHDARQPPPPTTPQLRPGPHESHQALLPRPSADSRPRDGRRESRAETVDDGGHDNAGEMPPRTDVDDDAEATGAAGPSGGTAAAGTVAGAGTAKPVTACFNCRALRQKCDRKMPCSRCTLRHRPCRYPSGSNRGRKHGNSFLHNTNSATVDRLLSRIGETAERDQVVAALLNFAGANRHTQSQSHHDSPAVAGAPSSSLSPSSLASLASPPLGTRPSTTAGDGSIATTTTTGSNTINAANAVAMAEPEFLASLVSPLHIMAAAITADTAPYHLSPNSPMAQSFLGNKARKNIIDERLSRYFATQTTHQRDWQVLATQPIDSPLKLETTTCDPVAARIIDQDDVVWYFKLFFKYRSPLVGLLDPVLHTPEYVRATSFVLFSALCALGCAVSDRPRDRVVYPALLSLAEGNMKWAIAVCVKSLETIQAIIVMQYWAPVSQRQADDPYWLRLSHAVQLGRELGIHRPATIAEQVNNEVAQIPGGATPEFRERLFRNFERTWLYTFISDKSFGIITGRSMGVAWKEMPAYASEWWRKPMTGPVDRIVSGIIEMRGLFLAAMEQRKRVANTLAAVEQWHAQTYRVLEQTRNARCAPSPHCPYLSVLAFYMDHSIMVLNAQALRDMSSIDLTGTSPELLHLSAMNVDIASRLLDTMLHDPVLLELMVGFHNNQFIMVCHAATEILYAIQRGGLSLVKVDQAASKVRAIPGHLDRIAARLPTTSAAHLYASLSAFFVAQLDKVVRNNAERYGAVVSGSAAGASSVNNTDDRSMAADSDDSDDSDGGEADGGEGTTPQPLLQHQTQQQQQQQQAQQQQVQLQQLLQQQQPQQQQPLQPQQHSSTTSSSLRALDRVIEPDQDSLLADWWKTVDGGLLDSTTWMDMGFLSSEQPILGSLSATGGNSADAPDGVGFNQSMFQ